MIYCSKRWLSKRNDETGSMVCRAITPRLKDRYGERNSVEASIVVRSCYGEPCELDFNIYSEKGLQDRLDKLDTMIAELVEFKAQLPGIWEDSVKVGEEYKLLHPSDEKEE